MNTDSNDEGLEQEVGQRTIHVNPIVEWEWKSEGEIYEAHELNVEHGYSRVEVESTRITNVIRWNTAMSKKRGLI